MSELAIAIETVVRLNKENAALKEKVDGIRKAIDDGEEDGLAAWVMIREIKKILTEK